MKSCERINQRLPGHSRKYAHVIETKLTPTTVETIFDISAKLSPVELLRCVTFPGLPQGLFPGPFLLSYSVFVFSFSLFFSLLCLALDEAGHLVSI